MLGTIMMLAAGNKKQQKQAYDILVRAGEIKPSRSSAGKSAGFRNRRPGVRVLPRRPIGGTMKKKSPKSAAVITIKAPGKMTQRGRRDIIKWLRDRAKHLEKHGKDYTEGTFTGRFFYT